MPSPSMVRGPDGREVVRCVFVCDRGGGRSIDFPRVLALLGDLDRERGATAEAQA